MSIEFNSAHDFDRQMLSRAIRLAKFGLYTVDSSMEIKQKERVRLHWFLHLAQRLLFLARSPIPPSSD